MLSYCLSLKNTDQWILGSRIKAAHFLYHHWCKTMFGFCVGHISEGSLDKRDGYEYQNDILIFVLRYSNIFLNISRKIQILKFKQLQKHLYRYILHIIIRKIKHCTHISFAVYSLIETNMHQYFLISSSI